MSQPAPPWLSESGPGAQSAPPAASTAGGLLGGLALGAGAAVIATVAWYMVVALTEYQIGFIAIAIGWLVGTAVVLGARRQVTIPLVVASPLLTLLALVVSEYLIIYHILTQEFGIALDLIQPIDLMIELVVESVAADPVTLFFWGLALIAAAYIPFRAMREQMPADSAYVGIPG